MVLICHSLNWWGMGFTWREKFSWCLIGFQMYVLECLSHFKSCSYIVPIHMPRCVCIKSRTLWNEIGCPYLLENRYNYAIEKAKIDSNYRLRSHEGTPCLFLLLFIFFKEQRVLNIFIFYEQHFFLYWELNQDLPDLRSKMRRIFWWIYSWIFLFEYIFRIFVAHTC